jgi:hypothetical protein
VLIQVESIRAAQTALSTKLLPDSTHLEECPNGNSQAARVEEDLRFASLVAKMHHAAIDRVKPDIDRCLTDQPLPAAATPAAFPVCISWPIFYEACDNTRLAARNKVAFETFPVDLVWVP